MDFEKISSQNELMPRPKKWWQLVDYSHHVRETRLFSTLAHDDVIKWKHFPRCWPFVRGIHRSPVNSAHKGQWRGDFMFSLICSRINGWVNNCEADDLRRIRPHYAVTVMSWIHGGISKPPPNISTIWIPSHVNQVVVCRSLGPLLLTWFNFNPSMDK